ncbi:MAG: trehalose-phosphatase [bacterium]
MAWAYFFDIDGTLVDLAATPSAVHPDSDIRRLVHGLYSVTGGAVALISGRSLADIDRLFPRVRLPAAGQHGLERRDATGRLHSHPIPEGSLDSVRAQLREAVARHHGLLIEDKGLSLALHYRSVPRLAGFAHRLMRTLQTELGNGYCVQPGKRVVELKPAGRDKGVAILEFMEEAPFRGRIPVFVGDDATDEYGFAVVNGLGGHSVKVGAGQTAASCRLGDVSAVRAWLNSLETIPALKAELNPRAIR